MKPWYLSKTVWFNVLAFAVLVANQVGFEAFRPDPGLAATIITLVNLALRFITRTGVGRR